ncbi:tyrosine-type recombinase/integrase [Xanthobacter oligotrophicus]|uniref:tyrosine-type recombinase/integrase n=1 Tax=Xanthobacter oligotrophicus TaxID=2607286 RepID=UPI001EE589AF|nr:site-specific integrase [Xanthobacter oligotrophicus]MCG5238120.1 integrase arm-type DNA-binding domain-containing protein [Xanthobacter oligotrophicus]
MAKPLTAKGIDALKPSASRREIPDGAMPGLYLIVQSSGAKSWAVRYRANGKPKKHTLGTYPAIKLADARPLASQALTTVAEGQDPSADKKRARREAKEGIKDDVDSQVTAFLERYAKPNLRPSSYRRLEGLLKNDAVAAWKGRSIKSITRRDVVDALDAAVDRGATVTANRLLAAVRRFFNWCVERGIIEASPAAGIKAPTAERSRDRILSDEELALVWTAADKAGWPFGPLVQLLVLTGQRRDEVAGMRWTELDIPNATWTIPGERTKNGISHVVPLSPEAVAIIEGLPHMKDWDIESPFVFTTTGKTAISGFSKAKAALDKAIAKFLKGEDDEGASKNEDEVEPLSIPDWRLHDLRRTMASGMARLSVPVHVVEKLLNHTSGTFSGIVAVYQRHDFANEKREAADAWGMHVAQLTIGAR